MYFDWKSADWWKSIIPDLANAIETLLSDTLIPLAHFRHRVQRHKLFTALSRTGDQSYFVENTFDAWCSEYLMDSPSNLSSFS